MNAGELLILQANYGGHVVAKAMRVLIGYASRFGSTRDIANRIADAVAQTATTSTFARSMRSRILIAMMPWCSEAAWTTDHGRQKRLN